jgi:hypothetical protein
MTFDPTQRAYSQAVGTARTGNLHLDTRDPTVNDITSASTLTYPIGYFWQNTTKETLWYLNNLFNTNGQLQANWILLSGQFGDLESLTGDDGNLIVPTSNNINVFGETVPFGTNAKPLFTEKGGTSELDIDIQLATTSTSGAKNINNAGIASFSSADFTIDSSTGFVALVGSGTSAVETLSDDEGTSVSPNSSGNIQLVGHINEQGSTKFSTVVAGSHLLNLNPMSSARWIVDGFGFNGTHTTITAAMASATAGDTIFILPGTYTESFTFKAGVSLVANTSDQDGNVIIVGKITVTSTGFSVISGLQMQASGDYGIVCSGSNAVELRLYNCECFSIDHTFLSYTNTGASSIYMFNTRWQGNTTGIAWWSMSSTAQLQLYYCAENNVGLSTTANTCSGAGALLQIFYSSMNLPITTSSSSAFNSGYTTWVTSPTNTLALTLNGTGNSALLHCHVNSGTASCITIGVGALATIDTCSFVSSNTNAITGAGSINYTCLSFQNSASINTTTQTGGLLSGGVFQAPSAGFIGEQIRSQNSGVSLSTGTPANITSIDITAGIWDVSAIAQTIFSIAGQAWNVAISANSASFTGTVAGDSLFQTNVAGASTSTALAGAIPSFRIILTTTTTYYLVVQDTHGSGTSTATGRISATRVG